MNDLEHLQTEMRALARRALDRADAPPTRAVLKDIAQLAEAIGEIANRLDNMPVGNGVPQ